MNTLKRERGRERGCIKKPDPTDIVNSRKTLQTQKEQKRKIVDCFFLRSAKSNSGGVRGRVLIPGNEKGEET